MDEDVGILEAAQDTPLDDILLAMVRLKLLANEARMPQFLRPSQPSEQLRALQTFQAKIMQSQIEQLKRLMPASMQSNGWCPSSPQNRKKIVGIR